MEQRQATRRPRRRSPAVTLLLAWLLAASAAVLPPGAAAQVLPRDKEALLAFKAGLTATGGDLLSTWAPTTDPCLDGWTGVKCSCDDFFATPAETNRSKVCHQPAVLPDNTRVLQLNFGDVRITQWNLLTGTISPALANLSSLRVLNLESNNLYGSLPAELSRLKLLEHVSLGGNRLTGALPAYLSTFPNLQQVDLANNQFQGSVPLEWCSGSWWQFDVSGNAGLCDEVPTCLYPRIASFEGTSLIDPINSLDMGMGGYCGVEPPTCDPDLGCRFLEPEPPFFTNASAISFTFSSFQSPIGGGPVRYRWALGTTRWGRDVLEWQDWSGTNSTRNVSTPSGTVVKRVYRVDLPLNQVTLMPGQQYFVTVQGSNDAGQQLGTMLSSQAIVADTTPPYLPDGSAVYSGQDFNNLATQSDTSAVAASWDPFVDDETSVVAYSYQVFEFLGGQSGSPGYVGRAVTNKTKLDFDPATQGEFRVYVINLDLSQGATYFVRVYARNGAGLEGYRDAPPVVVSASSGGSSSAVSVSKVVILVAVFVGAASALVALVTYWLMRESMRRHQAARKRMRGQMKNFKYLMQSLVQQTGDAEKRQLDELKQLKELAFVITDLEASTAIAAAVPKQFEKVQEMHDSLMRELIGRFHGYEINTEGDAFHVAFKDVQAAVLFCMEVQYQMMELDWPREVLRLGPCKEVKAPDGSLVYRGPRIRMGVHWATEGTVVQRLHQITKHRVFTGPAFQVTRELCEAAHGGQVLLSHEGWVRLRQNMAGAGFPVVEQLGQYKVDSSPAPIWVYQVTQLLGRPLHRQSGPLNFLEALEAGWGMSITRPPEPRSPKGHLAFVAARLALESCVGAPLEASPAVAKRLHELLATVAMQFGGYIFRLSESQAAYLLSFGSAADAVRFCHSAQALLMYSQWGAECADFCGRAELAPDGKPIFKGPRVAMAIHQSCEFTAISVPRQQAAADEVTTDYLGTAIERVQQLSEAAHGGQVIVSEKAWAAVQDQLPGQPHVVSLGSHLLDPSPATPPLLLMEVMPQVLARRTFPPPRTLAIVEPGYRDAPAADEPVAFVYVKVSKPAEVVDAEQLRPAVSDDTIIRVLTAYNVALSKATKLMRGLLRQYRGYECKEPEPGKLTLAFRSLEDAVVWGCVLQQELLGFAWQETVLEWAECREVRHPESTNLLWRGLRVKMGISYGLPASKAPLNTGRADYFGSVPNLAARLMAVAQPGQLLVDGRLGSMRDLQWRDDGGAVLLSGQAGPLEFTQLGYLQVKGLDEPKLVFQVLPALLRGRQYDALPTTARTAASSRHHSVRDLGAASRDLSGTTLGGGHNGSGMLSSQPSWGPGGLKRQASVDLASSEATPRQGSATSIRTPSLKRGPTLQPGSGGRGRRRMNILARTTGAGEGDDRRHSVEVLTGQDCSSSPGQDAALYAGAGVAPSGGSFLRGSLLGLLGSRLAGVLGRRGSAHISELGSPRSAGADLAGLTSRSGTTASNAPSFTTAGAAIVGGTTPFGSTSGHSQYTAAHPTHPLHGHHHRSASVGVLPSSGFTHTSSAVGSYASDSTLAAVAALPTSGVSTPMHGHRSGANSPPLTATRLRDAADWSYPGSTLTTPTTRAAGAGSMDPWEAGLAMEAALGGGTSNASGAAANQHDGLPPPLPHPQPVTAVAAAGGSHGHQHGGRQAASGLPPRGPTALHSHRGSSSGGSGSLEAALSAAGASREPSQSVLLPAGRTHSSSSTPAFLEAAEAAGIVAAVEAAAAAAAGADAAGGARLAPPSGSTSNSSGMAGDGVESLQPPARPPSAPPAGAAAAGQLPTWQSPARIAPLAHVPPLPLSRLSSSSLAAAGGTAKTPAGTARLAGASSRTAGAELELLPATSAAAPLGFHPPAHQPAITPARTGSGVLVLGGTGADSSLVLAPAAGGSAAAAAAPLSGSRRPSGLQQLDTQGLTFDTYGLESPDTITPGLQYARQVAQLFVEGRRRSTAPTNVSASAGTSAAASSPAQPSGLGAPPAGSGSAVVGAGSLAVHAASGGWLAGGSGGSTPLPGPSRLGPGAASAAGSGSNGPASPTAQQRQ